MTYSVWWWRRCRCVEMETLRPHTWRYRSILPAPQQVLSALSDLADQLLSELSYMTMKWCLFGTHCRQNTDPQSRLMESDTAVWQNLSLWSHVQLSPVQEEEELKIWINTDREQHWLKHVSNRIQNISIGINAWTFRLTECRTVKEICWEYLFY